MSTDNEEDNMQSIEINSILDRISKFTDSKSDSNLAKVLGVSRQVISGWRKRGSIPYEKLIEFAQVHDDLSLNYILYGGDESILEVPLEKDQASPLIMEAIGDELLDAIKQVKKEGGIECSSFMNGPQIFHYAAMIYNKIIMQIPSDQIWIPEIGEEVKHLIEIVKKDYQSNIKSSRDSNNKISNEKNNVTQHIHGKNHQIAGRDITNKEDKQEDE